MESATEFTSEPLPPTEEPAPSTAVEESAQGSVRPSTIRQSSAAVVGSEVSVAEVERALVELLRCYKGALKFAVDMPVFGRCEVSGVV